MSTEFTGHINIITDTEESKQQILQALEYIHDLHCIDTDYPGVGSLIHLYLFPDSIEVNPNREFKYGEQR